MQVIPLTDFCHGRMMFLEGVPDDRLSEATAEEFSRKGLVRLAPVREVARAPEPRNQSLPEPAHQVEQDPGNRSADGEATPSASSPPAPLSQQPMSPAFRRGPGARRAGM